MTHLPPGWKQTASGAESADGLIVDREDEDTIVVEWTETSDDWRGKVTRAARFPIEVIRFLLEKEPA